MALIVEFFGIPGSGKSYLRRNVVDHLDRGGVVVPESIKPSVSIKLWTALRHRRTLIAAVMVLVTSSRSWAEKVFAFKLFFTTLARFDVASRDPSDIVYIFDEGLIQRMFLLLVERDGVRTGTSRQLIDGLPRSQVLIHVVTSPEAAIERLQTRERGFPARLRGLEGSALRCLLDDADEVLTNFAGLSHSASDNPSAGHRSIVHCSSHDSTSVADLIRQASLER